jgi:hypothetical protein
MRDRTWNVGSAWSASGVLAMTIGRLDVKP